MTLFYCAILVVVVLFLFMLQDINGKNEDHDAY